MKIHLAAFVPFLLVVSTLPLIAQDDKPVVLGSFENTGSVTTGYRFTDVRGYQPKYQELFNLNSGFRVLDFSVFGKAVPGSSPFADKYSIVNSGYGGEPFGTTQMNVSRKDVYDLRVNFRQSHYYWNRNDSAVLPTGLRGLTSNHDWATVRKMGTLNLLVHATRNLRFNFEYFRNTRDGAEGTTRVMDYFGSSSAWGSFARANPYYLTGLISESSNRVTGGLDYTFRENWNFHYKLGVQRFEDSFTGVNAFTGQRSINVDEATTARELLTNANFTDYHRFTTPVSEFSYLGKINPKITARGSYLFYRYSGPAAYGAAAAGLARGTSTAIINPYSFSDSARANVREPNHVFDQGFTFTLNRWLGMQADYRLSRFNVFANGAFTSTAAGVTLTGSNSNEWRVGTNTFDYNVVLTPASSLLIRTGLRYMKSDVIYLESGIADPGRTRRIKSVWPTLSVFYQPNQVFSIRGDMDQILNGTSYTRLTPHVDVGGRIVTRVRPSQSLHIDNTTVIRNRKLLTADYINRVRSSSTTVTWEFSDRVSGFAGFAYDSFYSQSFVNFLRGPAPFINVTLLDQNVERAWQGGFNLVPVPRLTLSFAGNYVRVNGLGVVMGEVPLYGPMTFPYASGSLAYDTPHLGKLTVQLQRTYYTEQIVPGNNFRANLLLIALTRNF